jgi:hypothetical protein
MLHWALIFDFGIAAGVLGSADRLERQPRLRKGWFPFLVLFVMMALLFRSRGQAVLLPAHKCSIKVSNPSK